MISWEVFFGDRARDGVGHGGRVLLNPTNGSSYTGTILQTQQVASSRLRALETDRWVVQVAPTGFSAFVTPSGEVLDRTGASASRPCGSARSGSGRARRSTSASATGRSSCWPPRCSWRRSCWSVGTPAGAVAGLTDRQAPGGGRSHVEEHGDRPVVDELHGHLGAEPAGGHRGAEPA